MKMTGMYTAAGAQLAARALAEGKALTVTHAAAGSALTDPQATVMAAREQVLTIHSKTAQDTGCTVAAVLNAAEADASYTLREVALFASLAGEDEVLYKLFVLDESLLVEPDTDLVVTVYLTETILPAQQVQVNVSQQGLVTQAICTQTAREEAQAIQANLEAHAADTGAHSTLFGQKANTSHKHGAADVQSGTFTGIVAAMASTAYTTAQVRNIVLNTTEPSGGSNGLVWIKYTA